MFSVFHHCFIGETKCKAQTSSKATIHAKTTVTKTAHTHTRKKKQHGKKNYKYNAHKRNKKKRIAMEIRCARINEMCFALLSRATIWYQMHAPERKRSTSSGVSCACAHTHTCIPFNTHHHQWYTDTCIEFMRVTSSCKTNVKQLLKFQLTISHDHFPFICWSG